MSHQNILEEFKQLSVAEQIDVLASALKILQTTVQQTELRQRSAKTSLVAAAHALLLDYMDDEALTVFTVS